MTITKDDVLAVAELCKIAIAPDQMDRMVGQLSQILTVVSKLQEVDTTNVEPTTSVSGAVMPMREDIVTDTNIKEAVLANAETRYGCFIVPKVIE